MDPAAFHARVLAAADGEARLSVSALDPDDQIFPFEQGGLRVRPFEDRVVPEPAREGEDPARCRCATGELPERTVWADDDWSVRGLTLGLPALMLQPHRHVDLDDLDDRLAADLGILTVRISRALTATGGVRRVHVYRWGDGGAHLHIWFIARPEGVLQLRGSCVMVWEELLPRIPADELAATYAAVGQELASWRGAVTEAVTA